MCPVRAGDDNEHLRYAIRTWEYHIPHDELWIVGYKPVWLTGVKVVEGNLHGTKPKNVYHNVLDFCEHPDVPEQVVFMNDDMFALKPFEPSIQYRGSLLEHIAQLSAHGWWRQSLVNTLEYLEGRGHVTPRSYETHTPFPVDTRKMAKALRDAAEFSPDNPPQWRTVYGVTQEVGGSQATRDCKLFKTNEPGWTDAALVSTTDRSFRSAVRDYIVSKFPEPSRYETQ